VEFFSDCVLLRVSSMSCFNVIFSVGFVSGIAGAIVAAGVRDGTEGAAGGTGRGTVNAAGKNAFEAGFRGRAGFIGRTGFRSISTSSGKNNGSFAGVFEVWMTGSAGTREPEATAVVDCIGRNEEVPDVASTGAGEIFDEGETVSATGRAPLAITASVLYFGRDEIVSEVAVVLEEGKTGKTAGTERGGGTVEPEVTGRGVIFDCFGSIRSTAAEASCIASAVDRELDVVAATGAVELGVELDATGCTVGKVVDLLVAGDEAGCDVVFDAGGNAEADDAVGFEREVVDATALGDIVPVITAFATLEGDTRDGKALAVK
jgi:hypothetical protein